jgi:hypothetical protein
MPIIGEYDEEKQQRRRIATAEHTSTLRGCAATRAVFHFDDEGQSGVK